MQQRRLVIVFSAGLFLLVLGLKLDLVHRFGSDLPRWDALDAEGLAIYLPAAEGKLTPVDFIRPHNEHRVVWTKLLALAELKLNGQWDARLQCTVNAVLHSVIAVLVFLFARAHLDRRLHVPTLILVALLFGLPLGWENTISGFHSQQYFLVGFSLAAIAVFPFAAAWSTRWWVGAGCTVAAVGTMGSGFFAAGIVLGVIFLRGWIARDLRGTLRRQTPTLVVCMGTLALGAAGHVSVAAHETLRAHSAGEFAAYALRCLMWPARHAGWLTPLLWLPSALLARRVAARKETSDHPFPLTMLGLAGWSLLQILATAYARGGTDGLPSRYADTLAMGILANSLALAWLWPRLRGFRFKAILATLWALAFVLSSASQVKLDLTEVLPDNRRYLRASEQHVRDYLATGDPHHLDSADIPYPDSRALRERLDHSAIRTILPASVNEHATMASGSAACVALVRAGGWLAGLGALLLGIATLYDERTPRQRGT